jgi:hypothetical protein
VLLFLALLGLGFHVGVVSGETVNSSVIIGDSPKTVWTYLHSSTIAPRLVIEFGGGRVATNPFTNYTLAATVVDGNGAGGLFVNNEIDELILLSYPRSYVLTVGDPLAEQFNMWLREAVAWAWKQGYTQIFGYGYSAGAAVWMRYVLSDEFGHVRPSNETVTGIIAKAYANQSCNECFQYAANITLPILFLSGTEDTTAPLSGVEQFASKTSSVNKNIITFQTDHQGMATILPETERTWITSGMTTIPEIHTKLPLILMVLVMSIILIRKKK